VYIGRSRSSKVVDFGTNRKGVCDFLLVVNSNFGHTAIVTPVPKVAAPASLNDYRPISVTPVLSRIAEKHIVKHFIRPAIPRDAILDQFAFSIA